MREKFTFSNRVYYEIVSNCNLSCKHCSDLLPKQIEMIDVDAMLRFHEVVSKLGISECVITGGEPTLHPDLRKMVFMLSEYGKVVITTNATVITYEMVRELLGYNKNIHIQISLDGISKEVFERIRGNGQYEKVIKIINCIVNDGLQNQLALSMTIMRDNYDEISELIDFSCRNGIQIVHFPQLLPIGNAKKNWEDIAPSCDEQVCIENYFLRKITGNNNEVRISCNRLNQIASGWRNTLKSKCLDNMVIKIVPNGDILPCPVASGSKYRIANIRDIYESNQLYRMCSEKSIELTKLISKESLCDKKCKYYDLCQGDFCSNCLLLDVPEQSTFSYECAIRKEHLVRISKEMENG